MAGCGSDSFSWRIGIRRASLNTHSIEALTTAILACRPGARSRARDDLPFRKGVPCHGRHRPSRRRQGRETRPPRVQSLSPRCRGGRAFDAVHAAPRPGPGAQGTFFTWRGYDLPELFVDHQAKHGALPNFAIFGGTEEGLTKMRGGYPARGHAPDRHRKAARDCRKHVRSGHLHADQDRRLVRPLRRCALPQRLPRPGSAVRYRAQRRDRGALRDPDPSGRPQRHRPAPFRPRPTSW